MNEGQDSIKNLLALKAAYKDTLWKEFVEDIDSNNKNDGKNKEQRVKNCQILTSKI